MAWGDDPAIYSNQFNTRLLDGVVSDYTQQYDYNGFPSGFVWVPRAAAPTGIGPAAVATSTGVNPTENSYSLYGHIIPLSYGLPRIGGEIIAGPWIENGLASFCISFGVPFDPSDTRTLLEIAFDSEVVWSTNGTSGVTTLAGGTFSLKRSRPVSMAAR